MDNIKQIVERVVGIIATNKKDERLHLRRTWEHVLEKKRIGAHPISGRLWRNNDCYGRYAGLVIPNECKKAGYFGKDSKRRTIN